MIGDWKVRFLPRCSFHVFLSHSAEDRVRLVQPVYGTLANSDYSPWLDQNHYPKGQGAFESLREGILSCRHVVYFITARFLAQGRGWNSVENAYANLLQENLRFGSLELCHVQLPLIFLPHGHAILERSAWGPLIHRGRYYKPGRVDEGSVAWAVQQISSFMEQEEKRGAALAVQLQNDRSFGPLLAAELNLLRRIMCADPLPMP